MKECFFIQMTHTPPKQVLLHIVLFFLFSLSSPLIIIYDLYALVPVIASADIMSKPVSLTVFNQYI